MTKQVIIASENPVKIKASLDGFSQVFPNVEMEFKGIRVASEVADQPMTDEETLRGARNRANNAMKAAPDADYWVGIEGGIDETDVGMLAFAWVVILSPNQKGEARSSTFYLPPRVTQLIHSGVELGHANDQVFRESNSKQKGGAVGTLTGGQLGRTAYYIQPVVLALIPFQNPELYPVTR